MSALRCLEEEKSEQERQMVAGKFFQETLAEIRKVPAEVLNLNEISDTESFLDLLQPQDA